MKYIKPVIFLFVVGASFVYGIGLGKYHWFPYEEIKNMKQQIVRTNNIGYEFLNTVGWGELVVSDDSKAMVDCPPADAKLGVIVSFGQSNSANSGGYKVEKEEVPDVVGWYEGKCYEAASPLLGATGIKGEWITLFAQDLVNRGTYDKVVVLSLGVWGAPIAAWAEGGQLNNRLTSALAQLATFYKITDMIWHQGETDLVWGVGKQQYVNSFVSMENSIRKTGVEAPLFVSIASYCGGASYPNEISKAQRELAATRPGVVLGVNTDELITPDLRYDDCHFNEKGQRLTAMSAAELVTQYHKKVE